MTEEEKGWLRLHLTRGLGRTGIIRLMEAFGSLPAILAAPAAWPQQAGIRPRVAKALPAPDDPFFQGACRQLASLQVRILTLWDGEDYPPLLRSIHDPPALLYVRGQLPAQTEALAVVGARRAGSAGRRFTTDICSELASRGIMVVSGLARGIDTAAHQGALAGGGATVAVLGCGIDRIYPRENARLAEQILANGALLSEYPPGTAPLAQHFPGRNRIISGLSRGVLVVEAAAGSGSLITVDFALEQGREVFAVPGPVHAPTSDGVNHLLKEGAHLVTEPADILQELWPQLPSRQHRQQQESFAASLSGTVLEVYRHLEDEPLQVDELGRICGLTPMEVSAILLHLELAGGVEQLPGARYIRCRRP